MKKRYLEIYYSDDNSYSDSYSDQPGRYQLHELRAGLRARLLTKTKTSTITFNFLTEKGIHLHGCLFVFYLPFLVPDALLLGTPGTGTGTDTALEGIAINVTCLHDDGIMFQLHNHHSWFKIIPFHIFILFFLGVIEVKGVTGLSPSEVTASLRSFRLLFTVYRLTVYGFFKLRTPKGSRAEREKV